MIYLLLELTLFLLAAFGLGWWAGRKQRNTPEPPRVVDVALYSATDTEVPAKLQQRSS